MNAKKSENASLGEIHAKRLSQRVRLHPNTKPVGTLEGTRVVRPSLVPGWWQKAFFREISNVIDKKERICVGGKQRKKYYKNLILYLKIY